ncbi:MAG: RluA family pseudouridine synthase [Bdellovibrionaceae bacterium]|nr:RluA family pseudouridine synthase [Pseudobdellovibrionaceae bacterium]
MQSTKDDGVRHITNTQVVLLSEFIEDELGISHERFKLLLKLGAIYVNSYRATKDKWLFETTTLRVHTQPRRFPSDHPWRALIVFENDTFLILNKPAGLPSHPSVDNTLEDAMTQTGLAIKTPLYITHRLDTLTSGLIVYAKRKSFVKDFNMQLIARTIQKKYVALVSPVVDIQKRLVHYMDPAPGTPKKLSTEHQEGWDECVLEVMEQKRLSPKTLWIKINLLTGRTHQIRAQLAKIGAPIIGDTKYGSDTPYRPNAIALKSCEIEFDFEGRRLRFNLPDALEF